jgi:hypothetical protein
MKAMKCTFKDCPFEGEYDNLCIYHAVLVDFWFYELGGVKFHPAEGTFHLNGGKIGEPCGAPYPETADPDMATYRARYQAWARRLGQKKRDAIVVEGGGKPWAVFVANKGKDVEGE